MRSEVVVGGSLSLRGHLSLLAVFSREPEDHAHVGMSNKTAMCFDKIDRDEDGRGVGT